MKRLIRRRPRPGTIIAIVALIAALTGTAIAAGPFLPKNKFVKFKSNAVQRLTYVNNSQTVPIGGGATDFTRVTANCPSGFHPVGGGVKLSPNDVNLWWDDGYLTASGYASKVHNQTTGNGTALVTVACVAGRATGSPAG